MSFRRDANALEAAVTPSTDLRNFRHSSADWLLVFYPNPVFGRLQLGCTVIYVMTDGR